MISFINLLSPEAVAQRCSAEKVFLEISQNSQENTCASVYFLIKLQAWGLNTKQHLWWLLTYHQKFHENRAILRFVS